MCEDCPYLETEESFDKRLRETWVLFYCSQAQEKIGEMLKRDAERWGHEIPDWCPLKEAK